MDNRRFRYTLTRGRGLPAKRPKTLHCLWCREKFAVKPRGRLPVFCSHSCRQRAYEREKWQPPHLVRLQKDLRQIAVRTEIRAVAWALLQQSGLVDKAAALPEEPQSPRPVLRIVTRDPEE